MRYLLLGLLLIVSSASGAADGWSWWKFWQSVDETAGVSNQLFTPRERDLIGGYYRERGWHDPDHEDGAKGRDKPKKQKSLPPGLRKKLERGGQLPPGWQKKVARGEVMDAELYGHSRSLPEDLLRQLSGMPRGTEIRRVDDRVVRLLRGTNEILDVLQLNR